VASRSRQDAGGRRLSTGAGPVSRPARASLSFVRTGARTDVERTYGLAPRRRLAGAVLALGSLSALTAILLAVHTRLGLPSIFLLYLTAIVAVALVGGSWPALASAVATSFLINWFFTPPTRTWSISDPENLFALVVFVVVAAVVSVLVDREARARAAAERRRSETESLEKVNELRTALLAAVSHDLRTPLASIKASVSSLLAADVTWSPSETKDFLDAIEEDTDRLTSLVGNLLDMSRIQTGSLVLVPRRVGLDEIVPRALATLPSSGRDVEVDVPETLPRVDVDAELLERAVANVVANARQWSPADTPVRVTGRAHGDRVVLQVVDHGPGVPLADRDRMFVPFQRLGDRPGNDGIGLGLAVARGFVEAMGGHVAIEDTPGGGLTMVFTFAEAS
jgi:two-component system sensor histidine kinase KdpD